MVACLGSVINGEAKKALGPREATRSRLWPWFACIVILSTQHTRSLDWISVGLRTGRLAGSAAPTFVTYTPNTQQRGPTVYAVFLLYVELAVHFDSRK